MPQDEFQHFREAQLPIYNDVVAELADGRKRSHWMWFIFPQLQGLGRSAMAQRFALRSLDQARRYAADPELGRRLRQCTDFVNRAEAKSISEIFDYPDDLKFHSSMTLFALAAPGDSPFKSALTKFFGGKMDGQTIDLLPGAA
ncbi:MAG: DUF1810 domain-containing protein [Verrucomicrobiota bacterium]|jgi:uncharacterized protein (DUF1810 family)